MSYFPALLRLRGRRCVVVGGGEVAVRKARSLLEAGAEVMVIAPAPHPDLEAMGVKLLRRPYREGDLRGAFLAIAATDDPGVNRRVAEEARGRGVLVNVVDDPEGSDFISPSVLRRGELLVAVSSGGRSPALSRLLRRRLEGVLGPEWGELLEIVAEGRARLREGGFDLSPKGWERALEGVEVFLEGIREGEGLQVREAFFGRLWEVVQEEGKGLSGGGGPR